MILAILKLLKNGGMTLQLDPMDQPSCDAIHDGMDVFSAEQDDTVGISFKRGHKNKEEVFPAALPNVGDTLQLDLPEEPLLMELDTAMMMELDARNPTRSSQILLLK